MLRMGPSLPKGEGKCDGAGLLPLSSGEKGPTTRSVSEGWWEERLLNPNSIPHRLALLLRRQERRIANPLPQRITIRSQRLNLIKISHKL
jgi:hypothetical protein